MLHRTTWMAIPVIGFVVVGAGLGWWGYDQQRQRQALAIDTENQYSASFHALVSDVHHLQEELGKSSVSGDRSAFQSHVRNVWRLTFAAQTQVGRLPFSLMPMHRAQQFLSRVGDDADRWMNAAPDPAQPVVHRTVVKDYADAHQLAVQLDDLQGRVLGDGLRWLDANRALTDGKQDNQIVDGFRRIDTQASTFVESSDRPQSMHRGRTLVLQSETLATPQQARAALAGLLGVSPQPAWNVTSTGAGAYVKDYVIDGQIGGATLHALVSQHGAHVLSFHIDRARSRTDFNFADAQDKAQTWLASQQFGKVEIQMADQFDGTGYFVLAPVRDSSVVVSQGILVKVALDNGQVVGYDATNYYYYPVRDLPVRRYSADTLRRAVNPAFRVRMVREVIALDKSNQYQPAVAFYGTGNGETYCVYINANTGREMAIEQLTSHH